MSKQNKCFLPKKATLKPSSHKLRLPQLTTLEPESVLPKSDLDGSNTQERKKYGGLYDKRDGQYICLNCMTGYKSRHGLYSHLSLTNCGYGDRPKAKEKRN